MGMSSKELPEIGGLILRGNRCVLVRSLSGEWKGMRIPSMPAEPGELPAVTALCAVSEVCNIEAEDVEVLHGLAPVNSYLLRQGKMRPVSVHALYAVHPPPPGPPDAADEEDPEDIYDWYTFPRAMDALAGDQYGCAALASMALALAAGAAVGAVPDKWGGVFGQEWAAGSLRSLPSACGRTGGLELENATCEFSAPMGIVAREGWMPFSEANQSAVASSSGAKPCPRKAKKVVDRSRRVRVARRITKRKKAVAA